MATSEDLQTSRNLPSVWNTALERQQAWGPPAATDSDELKSRIHDLQADLTALVDDVRQGPLSRWRVEAGDFLGELRREFLRHHRRLVVRSRHEHDGEPSVEAEWLRIELAELVDRFRAVSLGRASRLTHGGWSPLEIVTALDQTVAGVPSQLIVPLESSSYEDPADQSIYAYFARRALRTRRWAGRVFGGGVAPRAVPLRALAAYHLAAAAQPGIEGLASLFIQAEVQLAVRTRIILDGIVRGYDVLVARVDEGDFGSLLVRLRADVEEEFKLTDVELRRIVDDGALRATRFLADGLSHIKSDAPIIGTLDLPQRRRRPRRMVEQRNLDVRDLDHRLERVRETSAGQYTLLALHLEFVSFKARAKRRLDERLNELSQDVRGRSHVQAERVLAVLNDAIEVLQQQREVPGEQEDDEAALGECLLPVERVLSEALRAGHQLLDQFSADQSVAPLLEALLREATSLTDRYRVPATKLPHAEWTLPPASTAVEVSFSELVSAYIQTDVAPRLLEVAAASGEKIRPLLLAFEDLERVVTFSSEQFDDELAYREPATVDLTSRVQIRELIAASLTRSRKVIEVLAEASTDWPTEISATFREAVITELSQLRDQLAEGEITEHRPDRVVEIDGRFNAQLQKFTGYIERAGEEGSRTVRRVVGDDRIAEFGRRLGIRPRRDDDPDLSLLARPDRNESIPIYYRRLFSPQAHWAGDVIASHESSVERIRAALTGQQTLRAAALVGVEGVGRGAFVSAASRTERWTLVKRVAFTRPAQLSDIEAVFEDVNKGSLVVIGGLGWTLSAKPGGLEPLRRLVDGVVADRGKSAWLLESDALVWRYACQCAAVGDVFSEAVHVSPLEREELEAAIIARQKLSGLELRFGVDESDRQRFFESLHVASGGLLQVALTAWIASIDGYDETAGVVTIGEPPPSPMDALRALPEDVLLTIYLTARQGWIDTATLASLFRISDAAAEGRLSRLVSVGLLERSAGGAFVIRRHLRGAVVRVLHEDGWTA